MGFLLRRIAETHLVGAGRVHIALDALQLPFEQELIDLKKPRTPEYLAVNPRGKVPALMYNGEILTESAIVAQFLADLKPGVLWPASDTPEGALRRARITWIVDAYFEKVNKFHGKMIHGSKTEEEAEAAAKDFVDGVVKEMEPELKNADPYFDGSKTITLAEVRSFSRMAADRQALMGPFILRLHSAVKHGMVADSFTSDLQKRAPNFARWMQAVVSNPTVISIYPEDTVIQGFKERKAKTMAA